MDLLIYVLQQAGTLDRLMQEVVRVAEEEPPISSVNTSKVRFFYIPFPLQCHNSSQLTASELTLTECEKLSGYNTSEGAY